MFEGFDGFVKQLTYFGGAAVVTGALIYAPVTGMGYGPYASGAIIVVGAGIGASAFLLALAQAYK